MFRFSTLIRGLLPLLVCISVVAQEDTITVCSADGNTTCTDAGNRVCLLNTTSSVEECGNCALGYVDFRDDCLLIEDIDFDVVLQLISNYTPQLIARNVTDEVRVARLKRLAQVVSFFNSRVPPISFQLGLNKYSLDVDEERARLLGTFAEERAAGTLPRFDFGSVRRSLRDDPLPAAVDWNAEGAMTYVKDQGRCGCCWAVSTVAAIEAAAFITNGTEFSESLSFQQLISCDDEDLGCNGGNIFYAMNYAWKNGDFGIPGQIGGIATYSDYPFTDSDYDGGPKEPCEAASLNATIFLEEPEILMTTDDDISFEERSDRMKTALSYQPVTVVMASDCDLLMSYRKGILTDDGDCACENIDCIDHAVVMTGYNDNDPTPYWILRNSWGDTWGESGYFRVAQAESGRRYGLFAVLAESAIPLAAYNTSAAEPDDDEEVEGWAIALIVIGGLLLLCCICGAVAKFCGSNK